MPGTTISTTIDTAITLDTAGYVGPISIASTGAIEPMQYGATALTVPAGAVNATVTNHGRIVGGDGLPPSPYHQYGAAGGDGVRAGAGARIVNHGTILGGGSTTQNLYGFDGGGTGVDIYGVQAQLTNNAVIDGGADSAGGVGGIGVSVSSGAIVINNGIIAGGGGGNVSRVSGAGVVVQNASLINNGTIEGGFTNLDIEPESAGVVLSAGKVTNHGVITGGAGVAQSGLYNIRYGAAGAGVMVTLAGSTLVNDATIHGGIGDFFAGVGGVGVAAYDASTVINNGLITGGWSGAVTKNYRGYTYTGFGGDGVVLRSGARLTNHGVIIGGTGGPHGSYGGTGAYLTNAYGNYPDIAEITNQGLITGGKGGRGAGGGGAGMVVRASGSVSNEGVVQGGVGGAAGYNANSETYKVNGGEGGEGFLIKFGGSGTNAGAIIGGKGGQGSQYGGAGGIGVFLSDGTLTNAGTISGGSGGYGKLGRGKSGDAVFLDGHATLIVENGAVFKGQVVSGVPIGEAADVLELSGHSSKPLTGIGTQIIGFYNIGFAANAAWTIAGDTAGLTTGQEIEGFTSSDAIELTDAAASSGQVSVGTAGVVTLSAGGDIYKLDLAGATVGETNFTFSDYTLRESVMSPAPAMTFLRPAQPAAASPSLFTAPGPDHFMTVSGFHASLLSGIETTAWANHSSITTALHIGAIQDMSRPRQGEVQTLVTLHA